MSNTFTGELLVSVDFHVPEAKAEADGETRHRVGSSANGPHAVATE